jgi:hypothetical protein
MQTDSRVVDELRSLFKAGATPSALVRRIAELHHGELSLDRLARVYFREAFGVPMLQIGSELVDRIACGEGCAPLTSRVVHQMVAARREWDRPNTPDGPQPACWLDSVTATDDAALLRAVEAGTLPEFASCWEHLDEGAKRFIARTVAGARALHEKVQILAALAERLQEQLHAVELAQTRTEQNAAEQ